MLYITEEDTYFIFGTYHHMQLHSSLHICTTYKSEVTFCQTLCDPMDCNLSGFSDHGIFQAKILEWVAIFFSRGSSRPRGWTRVSCIADRRFTIWATRETQVKEKVKVAQSCLTLCDPMDYKVHGILQARMLEYSEAFPFSRGSSQPRNQTQASHIAGGCFTSWAIREAQEYWCG